MATNLTIAVNTGLTDESYETSSAEWTIIDTANDYIIFTAGSDTVKDGEPLPSSSDLNQAGIILTGSQIIVDKYLLADADENELKQIHNMGNKNKRYVLAFDFDGETTSEPVLEAWDNSDMDTIDSVSLGNGLASGSWLKGIVTTLNTPGADWSGVSIAGSADGYFLLLNNGNGALDSSATLYCNLKLIIPATQLSSGANNPIIVCKYTTN